MKKQGILNSDISKVLTDLRHTDRIIIGDCGLPVPKGVQEIDLALTIGTPSFLEVLDVVLSDMKVEKAIIATEIASHNVKVEAEIAKRLTDVSYVSHEELKELSKDVKAIIRTGEATPYANIILQSGVIF